MLRNLDVVFDGLEPPGCCSKSMRDWRNEAVKTYQTSASTGFVLISKGRDSLSVK